MKFTVDTAHREFFKKNLAIEFEAFFTSAAIESIQKEILSAVYKRLVEKGIKPGRASSEQLYMVGRDIWRATPALQKFVTQAKMADIAADLIEQRELRLGYDQFLPQPPIHLDKLEHQPYVELLKLQDATLESISSIQGILCGLLICLQEPLEKAPLYPSQLGNVVYLDPKAVLNFSLHGGSYLLIAYTRPKAVYIIEEKDPHAHAFKHLGYGIGDILSDKFNPMVKK